LGNTTLVNMACFVPQAKQSCSFLFYVKAQNLSQIWNSKDHMLCGHLKKAFTLFGSRGKEVVVHH
jgi:hypothetical protein